MSIKAVGTPVIPAGSSVVSKKVLVRQELTIQVSTGNSPTPNKTVAVQSNHSVDQIAQPTAPSDGNGMAVASVQTRDQSSASTITSASADIATKQSANIAWLPAHYENNFLITCYVISNENDFTKSRMISNVPGLPPTAVYHQDFINDVRMQGSGQAISGAILHYDGNGRYSTQSCARTATGACAVDGTTIAVDKTVVPLRGSVAITTVGARIAQDTGGGIIGNHIDEYYGTRRSECRTAGKRNLGVDFTNY
jgi:3D (Asp-Asp-Asp) domain-containing protein